RFRDVFTKNEHSRIAPHLFGERFANRFAHRQFACLCLSLCFKHKCPGRLCRLRGRERRWQTEPPSPFAPPLPPGSSPVERCRRTSERSSNRKAPSTDHARFSTSVLPV